MKLESICEVVRGSSPRPQGDKRYYGGSIPRLMVADITRDGKQVIPKIDSLTEQGAKLSRPMKQGDIVIAVSGNPGLPAILAVDACIHDGFAGLRNLDIAKICKDYLYHYLIYIKNQNSNKAVGAIFKNLTTDQIKNIEIPLPPLAEQQRIAAILDKADALREKRRRAIAKLDELLESSFLQLYENKLLLNTMKLEDVAEKSRGSFVNGPFGSDLLTSELTKSGVPVIYIRDIREGEYNRVSESFVSKDKAEKLSVCSVFPRDVLIAKVGDPPGTAALYPDNEPYGIVTQDVIRIRTNNQIVTPEFLVSYFNSSIGCWNLSKIIIEATRARFSLTDLKKLSLEIPSLSQQKQFSSIAKKIFALKLQQKKSLDKLDILFLSLQQRAFSGELFAQQANEELDKVANEEKPGQMSLFDLMG